MSLVSDTETDTDEDLSTSTYTFDSAQTTITPLTASTSTASGTGGMLTPRGRHVPPVAPSGLSILLARQQDGIQNSEGICSPGNSGENDERALTEREHDSVPEPGNPTSITSLTPTNERPGGDYVAPLHPSSSRPGSRHLSPPGMPGQATEAEYLTPPFDGPLSFLTRPVGSLHRFLDPNLARKAARAVPAVVLGTLLNILDGVSYGMIIFPAKGIFAKLGGLGVSMFFLVYVCGGSNFAGANGSMMIEVVVSFRVLPCFIRLLFPGSLGGARSKEVIATTLVAFAFSSLITGLTFFLLGYLRLGVLIGFFPRHILVGTRLPSDALDPPTFENLRYFAFDPHALAQWVPPLVLAVLLRVITARWKHQLLFPIYFLIIPIIFYIVVAAAQLDLDVLRREGWLFEAAQSTGGVDKWYAFYTYYDWSAVRWTAVWMTLPTQFALLFFNILHPPLNVPALAVSLDEDIDTNKELVGHGYSNLAAGLLGTVPNYLVYVNTLLFYRVGGGNRVAGFMLALATFMLLIIGTAPIAYIPVMVVSALIFVLGIDLVKEALWDTRHRVSRMEYVTIISIMVTMTVWDFVIGVLFGIVVSCFFFVVQNSQRRSIRACYTGDAAVSTVRRPTAHRAYIREVSRQTRIIRLQGFLFFGTIAHVEDTLRSLVDDPTFRTQPVRFVVLDFSLVAGVDLSAAEAFVRVQRLLAEKGVVLVFCGVSSTGVEKALGSVGILEEPYVELFETLNDAMEFFAVSRTWHLSVNEVIPGLALPGRQHLDVDSHQSLVGSPRRLHLKDAGERTIASELVSTEVITEPLSTLHKVFASHDTLAHTDLSTLAPYFEQVSYSAGFVLWETNDLPDGLYIIQSGVLRASYKFAEHSPVIEESMVSGTLAGEMSALSGLPRNATVVVERDAVLWKLSADSMRRLEEEHPHLAQRFVRLVLKAAKIDTDTLLAALATG
ncbi:sulfate transporter family-domain-containing protein [Melanogaster broomeanus]|nr:sulfate transporter family-domain-containing protein [Melanogaster broomeanus]